MSVFARHVARGRRQIAKTSNWALGPSDRDGWGPDEESEQTSPGLLRFLTESPRQSRVFSEGVLACLLPAAGIFIQWGKQ